MAVQKTPSTHMFNPDFADNDVVNAAVYVLPWVSFSIPTETYIVTHTSWTANF